MDVRYRTPLNEYDERQFLQWYASQSLTGNLPTNPDGPDVQYDYRGAWRQNEGPDEFGVWPSRYKDFDHPDRYINLSGEQYDTIYGEFTGQPFDGPDTSVDPYPLDTSAPDITPSIYTTPQPTMTDMGGRAIVPPAAQKGLAAASVIDPTPAPLNLDNSLTTGFTAGIMQTPRLTGKTLEVVGRLTGQNGLVSAGQSMSNAFESAIPELQVQGFDQIQSVGDAITFAGESIGQGIGTTIPIIGAAALAAPISGGAALSASALAAYTLITGEMYDQIVQDEQQERGGAELSEDELRKAAAVAAGVGTVGTALDVASLNQLRLLPEPARRRLYATLGRTISQKRALPPANTLKELISNTAKDAGKGFGLEGATEGAQAASAKAASDIIFDRDWTNEDTEQVAFEAVAGGLGGAALSGGASIVDDQTRRGRQTRADRGATRDDITAQRDILTDEITDLMSDIEIAEARRDQRSIVNLSRQLRQRISARDILDAQIASANPIVQPQGAAVDLGTVEGQATREVAQAEEEAYFDQGIAQLEDQLGGLLDQLDMDPAVRDQMIIDAAGDALTLNKAIETAKRRVAKRPVEAAPTVVPEVAEPTPEPTPEPAPELVFEPTEPTPEPTPEPVTEVAPEPVPEVAEPKVKKRKVAPQTRSETSLHNVAYGILKPSEIQRVKDQSGRVDGPRARMELGKLSVPYNRTNRRRQNVGAANSSLQRAEAEGLTLEELIEDVLSGEASAVMREQGITGTDRESVQRLIELIAQPETSYRRIPIGAAGEDAALRAEMEAMERAQGGDEYVSSIEEVEDEPLSAPDEPVSAPAEQPVRADLDELKMAASNNMVAMHEARTGEEVTGDELTAFNDLLINIDEQIEEGRLLPDPDFDVYRRLFDQLQESETEPEGIPYGSGITSAREYLAARAVDQAKQRMLPEGEIVTRGQDRPQTLFMTNRNTGNDRNAEYNRSGYGGVYTKRLPGDELAPGIKWGYDNGAYPIFAANNFMPMSPDQFNLDEWMSDVQEVATHPRADDLEWIVLPDLIANGQESLELSRQAVTSPDLPADVPYYLAVQEGMVPEDVLSFLLNFPQVKGVFIGGKDDAFKFGTEARLYAAMAHELGLKVHVGRTRSGRKVSEAMRLGADSVDSAAPNIASVPVDDPRNPIAEIQAVDPANVTALLEQTSPEARERLAKYDEAAEPLISSSDQLDQELVDNGLLRPAGDVYGYNRYPGMYVLAPGIRRNQAGEVEYRVEASEAYDRMRNSEPTSWTVEDLQDLSPSEIRGLADRIGIELTYPEGKVMASEPRSGARPWADILVGAISTIDELTEYPTVESLDRSNYTRRDLIRLAGDAGLGRKGSRSDLIERLIDWRNTAERRTRPFSTDADVPFADVESFGGEPTVEQLRNYQQLLRNVLPFEGINEANQEPGRTGAPDRRPSATDAYSGGDTVRGSSGRDIPDFTAPSAESLSREAAVLNHTGSLPKSDKVPRRLVNAVHRKFQQNGYVNLRGQKVSNAHELAKIAQVYRNPTMEQSHIWYVDQDTGEVLAHEAATSRAVGNTATIWTIGLDTKKLNTLRNEDPAKALKYLRSIYNRNQFKIYDRVGRLAKRATNGRILVYTSHNHPNGITRPSAQDRKNTILTNNALQSMSDGLSSGSVAFGGEIVIDSNEFSVISESGQYTTYNLRSGSDLVEGRDLEGWRNRQRANDPTLRPMTAEATPELAPWIYRTIYDVNDVAELTKLMTDALGDDIATIVGLNAGRELMLVETVPMRWFENDGIDQARNYLRNLTGETGSNQLVIYFGGQEHPGIPNLTGLVEEQEISDFIWLDEEGVGSTAKELRDWMGSDWNPRTGLAEEGVGVRSFADVRGFGTAPESVELEQRYDPMDLEIRAVEIFGETTDPYEAGYILSDGALLDFSGKNEGGPAGMRSLDHRQISALEDADGNDMLYNGGLIGTDYGYMHDFMRRTHAVRLYKMQSYVGFHYVGPLTKYQRAVMSRLVRNAPYLTIDEDDPKTGYTLRSVEINNPMQYHLDAFIDEDTELLIEDGIIVNYKADVEPFGEEDPEAERRRQMAAVRRQMTIDAYNNPMEGQPSSRPIYGLVNRVNLRVSEMPQAMSSDDFMTWLRKSPGIKQEAIEAIGLDRWAGEQKKITPNDALSYMARHLIELYDIEITPASDAPTSYIDSDVAVGGDNMDMERLFSSPKNRRELLMRIELPNVGYKRAAAAYTVNDTFNPGDSHWAGYPNILGWLRASEGTDADGKRVFIIDEIQSDWQKKARGGRTRGRYDSVDYTTTKAGMDEVDNKRGMIIRDAFLSVVTRLSYERDHFWSEIGYESEEEFREVLEQEVQLIIDEGHSLWAEILYEDMIAMIAPPDFGPDDFRTLRENFDNAWADYKSLAHEQEEANRFLRQVEDDLPYAPFQDSWYEIIFKRAIDYAHKNAFDAIAWTDGRTQEERYSLTNYGITEYRIQSKGRINPTAYQQPNHDYYISANNEEPSSISSQLVLEMRLGGNPKLVELVNKAIDERLERLKEYYKSYEIVSEDVTGEGDTETFWSIANKDGMLLYTTTSRSDAEFRLESLKLGQDYLRDFEWFRTDYDGSMPPNIDPLYPQERVELPEIGEGSYIEGDVVHISRDGLIKKAPALSDFYNKTLPRFANKYIKSKGGTVAPRQINIPDSDYLEGEPVTYLTFDIPQQLAEEIDTIGQQYASVDQFGAPPKKPIRTVGSGPNRELQVVDVFGGQGAARQALQNLSTTAKYYDAAELPEGKVDVLLGGSMAQDLSYADTGLIGEDAASFSEFTNMLDRLQPTHFMFETKGPVAPDVAEEMTKQLGVAPIIYDHAAAPADRRKRLFFTNIPQSNLVPINVRPADVLTSSVDPSLHYSDLDYIEEIKQQDLTLEFEEDAYRNSNIGQDSRIRRFESETARRLAALPDRLFETSIAEQLLRALDRPPTQHEQRLDLLESLLPNADIKEFGQLTPDRLDLYLQTAQDDRMLYERTTVADPDQQMSVPVPTKTQKGYKVLRTMRSRDGVYPLYIDTQTAVPFGEWIPADFGTIVYLKGSVSGKDYISEEEYLANPLKYPDRRPYVLGKGNALFAPRPGWHLSDHPAVFHIGGKGVKAGLFKKYGLQDGANYRKADEIIVEAEVPADVDWQAEADSRGAIAEDKDIRDQIPVGGYYKYRTNPNMASAWMIAGSVKLNRVLSRDEVNSIGSPDGPDLPMLDEFIARHNIPFEDLSTAAQQELKVYYPDLYAMMTGGGMNSAFVDDFGAPRKIVTGLEREENFRRWFKDSKVVDESGEPIVLYRGDNKVVDEYRAVPVIEGGSGAIYLTDDPKIASNYAITKQTRIDDDHDFRPFTTVVLPDDYYRNELLDSPYEPGEPIGIVEAARFLRAEDKTKLRALAIDPDKNISYKRMGYSAEDIENEGGAYSVADERYFRQDEREMGDVISALFNIYIQSANLLDYEDPNGDIYGNDLLVDAIRETGVFKSVLYENPIYQKPNVTSVYASIKNPYDVTEVEEYKVQDLIENFNDVPERDKLPEDHYIVYELENRNTITTVTPALRTALLEQGYDGIRDATAGTITGGDPSHVVYIALDPKQIKSATGNDGRFDPVGGIMSAAVDEFGPEGEATDDEWFDQFVRGAQKRSAESAEPQRRRFADTAERFGYEITNQTYEPIANEDVAREVEREMQEIGPALMSERLMGDLEPSALNTARAVAVMAAYSKQAQESKNAGNIAAAEESSLAAVRVADELATRLTQAGQMIQAVKLMSRLTPATIYYYAQKKLNEINNAGGSARPIDAEAAQRLTEIAEEAEQLTLLTNMGKEITPSIERVLQGEDMTPGDVERVKGYVAEVKKTLTKGETTGGKKPKRREQIRNLLGQIVRKRASAARERLKAKGIRFGVGFDPTDLRDWAEIGAEHIVESGTKFADYYQYLHEQLGLDEGKHIRQIYKESLRIIKTDRASARKGLRTIAAIEKLANDADVLPVISYQDALSLSQLASQVRQAVGEQQEQLAATLQNQIHMLQDPTLGQKIKSIQTIGMLLNPRTLGVNIISNEIFWNLEMASRLVAAGLDRVAASVSGDNERGVTFRFAGRGGAFESMWMRDSYRSALMEGALASIRGEVAPGMSTKYELPPGSAFGGKGWIQQAAERLTGKTWEREVNIPAYFERTLGVFLRGFDYAGAKRSRDYALAETAYRRGLKEGISEDAMDAYIDNFIAKSYELEDEILQGAMDQALYVTFQDDNAVSQLAQQIKGMLNQVPGVIVDYVRGDELRYDRDRFGLGELLLKFPKTPTNLFMRAVDYSPLGLINLYKLSDRYNGNESEVNDGEVLIDMARMAFGTLGMTAAGIFFEQIGILTGKGDDDRDEERFLRDEMGIQPYAVNLSAFKRLVTTLDIEQAQPRDGDYYHSYNWLQPMAISLAVGANLSQNYTERMANTDPSDLATEGMLALATGAAGAASVGFSQSFQDLPMLQSLTQVSGQRDFYGLDRVVAGAPASFIPSSVNMLRRVIDPVVRDPYSGDFLDKVGAQLMNRIPFLSEQVPERWKQLPERDDLGDVIYGSDGRPLVEPQTYSDFDAERADAREWTLYTLNTFFSPGRATEYELDPFLEVILGPYGSGVDGEDVGIPNGDPATRRLPRDMGGGMVRLTSQDRSTLRKVFAEEYGERIGRINPDRFARLSEDRQVKALRSRLLAARKATTEYWRKNLQYKYATQTEE